MEIKMLDVVKDSDGDIAIDIRLDDDYAIGVFIVDDSYTAQLIRKGDANAIQYIEDKPVRVIDEEF